MIEFKSDCGHTVRAKDEDAGKKVRCSYCGKDAKVPSTAEDDFDFLFGELDLSESSDTGVGRYGRPTPTPSASLSRRRRGEFNTPGVVLKFVYLTVLISIIAVVTKKGIMPYFDGLSNPKEAQGYDDYPPRADQLRSNREDRRSERRAGLIGLNDHGGGLYIASFPPEATAYYVDSDAVRRGGRVADQKNCRRARSGEQCRVSAGTFTVEVVLPWNAPSLTRYPGYNVNLRRKLGNATGPSERDRVAADYFLPDGADDVFVSESDGQIYIVRQFHDVKTRSDRWTAVRALFVPADLDAGWPMALAVGVTDYMPSAEQYVFDEEHVGSELEYYNVPPSDRAFVLDILRRVGVMPYVTVDPQTRVQRTHLFKITIEDGMFAAPVLSESGV